MIKWLAGPPSKPKRSVLITAGPVIGRLDDNKLVSNRSRGLWAMSFARQLTELGYFVQLLVPDTLTDVEDMTKADLERRGVLRPRIIRHNGFEDYQEKCRTLVKVVDVAIMAAAVVNWIPAEPIKGKMPTKGYKPGDRINVPFVLAPRVIEEMKQINPKMTLIGCKMLSGAPHEDLIEAAYHVVLASKCNAVVANDLSNLRTKYLVHQDRTVQTFENAFPALFDALLAIIEDEHYHTVWDQVDFPVATPGGFFDQVVDQYRERFVRRTQDSDCVFGALYEPTGDISLGIVSPREKGQGFSAKDAVVVEALQGTTIQVCSSSKATLNAPLLVRVSQKYPGAKAVLHLHEQLPGYPTVSYAPPGTVRDNDRAIPGPVFNIEGHGFVACLDENGDIFKP